MKYFDDALELILDYKYAFYFKGEVYEDIQLYDTALKCFDKSIAADPYYIGSWFEKGNLLVF